MKKCWLLLGVYFASALLVFAAVAIHFHNRVAATAPTETGIQSAIENGNVSTAEDVTVYDYATNTERYVVTVSEENVEVFYENRDTEIAVRLVNGEKVETIDMQYERSRIREVSHLSQNEWLTVFAVIGLTGAGILLIYGFRFKKS